MNRWRWKPGRRVCGWRKFSEREMSKTHNTLRNVVEPSGSSGSLHPAGSARSSFERWISGPPYERETERWPQDEHRHAWPGQYKDIAVQLAWESWQQAQNNEKLTDRGANNQ